MANLRKIPKTDIEYIEFYAEGMKKNNALFKQQKKLIDSQIKASRDLFSKSLGKGDLFKKKARSYLQQRGVI